MREYRAVWYRGRWAVEWREGAKRYRKSLGVTERNDLPRSIDALRAQHDALDKPEVATVAYAWDGFRRALEGRPAAITMGYEWKAVGPHFGLMPADSVREEDCDAYIAARRKLGRSDGTIWTELGHLRSALNWAARKNLIVKAPAIKRPQRPPPRDKRLTKAQAKQFLDACEKPHVKLFVRLALATAARMGALLDLTWDRVDFEQGVIGLHDPAKGRSNKGRAIVPMNAGIKAALREAYAGSTSKYVIEWGGAQVRNIKKGISATGKRAGLEWVTAHVFRHTAAVWLAESGVGMAEIAQYLGHSNSRVTESVYARFSPTYLRKAAQALEF